MPALTRIKFDFKKTSYDRLKHQAPGSDSRGGCLRAPIRSSIHTILPNSDIVRGVSAAAKAKIRNHSTSFTSGGAVFVQQDIVKLQVQMYQFLFVHTQQTWCNVKAEQQFLPMVLWATQLLQSLVQWILAQLHHQTAANHCVVEAFNSNQAQHATDVRGSGQLRLQSVFPRHVPDGLPQGPCHQRDGWFSLRNPMHQEFLPGRLCRMRHLPEACLAQTTCQSIQTWCPCKNLEVGDWYS